MSRGFDAIEPITRITLQKNLLSLNEGLIQRNFELKAIELNKEKETVTLYDEKEEIEFDYSKR